MVNNTDKTESFSSKAHPFADALLISKDKIEDVINHAVESMPFEACGILGGIKNRIERVFRMKNIDTSEASYCLDAGEQMKVMQDLKRSGLQMTAIYHSHPASPAIPSNVDIDRAFFPGSRDLNYPDTAHLIVGLSAKAPEIRAFSINSNGIREIKVIIGE